MSGSVGKAVRADGWVRGGQYHLELSGWTIAKVTVQDVVTYELWKRKEYLGVFLSADDAKSAMRVLSAGEQLYAPIF